MRSIVESEKKEARMARGYIERGERPLKDQQSANFTFLLYRIEENLIRMCSRPHNQPSSIPSANLPELKCRTV